MLGRSITINSPAKINLYLHITGKRSNNYHEIDSLAVLTDFGDTLTISSAKAGQGVQFSIYGPFRNSMGPEEDNLVIRAVDMMLNLCKPSNRDIHFKLTKRIPVAAGIGGGSSNAAAALMALNRYWEAKLPPNELMALGCVLGSDVPTCMSELPIFVSGIGEKIKFANRLPSFSILLINPSLPLKTHDVFQTFNGKFSSSGAFKYTSITVTELCEILYSRSNDLYKTAIQICPEIDNIIQLLNRQPGCLLARMSGSGATCFGLFPTTLQAASAYNIIKKSHPHWWCTYTHPIRTMVEYP